MTLANQILRLAIIGSLIVWIGCVPWLIKQPSHDAAPGNKPVIEQQDISDTTEFSVSADTLQIAWDELTDIEKLDSVEDMLGTNSEDEEKPDKLNNAAELLSSINYEQLDEDASNQFTELLIEVMRRYVSIDADEEFFEEDSLADFEVIDIDSLRENLDDITLSSVEVDTIGLEEAMKVESLPSVPTAVNSKVLSFINYFQTKKHTTFQRWLDRAGLYIPIMTPILRAEGLPDELIFLCMIESGFSPRAYSYAHASGPWQFIPSTGKIFNLKSDWWYDERRDPVRSTIAATKYLKKLYHDFDDWYLAMAAYNCGEGRVAGHIRRYNTKDFWELKKLPRQTREYLPKYLAAMTIAQNPTAYGFRDIEYRTHPKVDTIIVTDCVDMEVAAKFVGISFDSLKTLNPMIIRWCTPPNLDSVELYVPYGTKDKFIQELALLPPEKKHKWIAHRVSQGQTLSTIAESYGTSVWAIRSFKRNNIRNKHRISIGQIIYVPIPPKAYKKSIQKPITAQIPPPAGSEKFIYKVKKGDVLSVIAERYGVGLSVIKRWNNLSRKKYIYPGQKLTIWIPKSKKNVQDVEVAKVSPKNIESKSSEEFAQADTNYKIYKMLKGDTLWDISIKNKVSIKELKRINNIKNHRNLRPGDEIKIPVNQ